MAIQINGNGTITGISVGGLPNGIVDTDMIAANAVSSAKLATGAGGKILQVVQTVKNEVTTSTSGSFTAISGLSASITPSSASNKILIRLQLGTVSTSNNQYGVFIRLHKDGSHLTGATAINVSNRYGVFAGGRTTNTNHSQGYTGEYLDTAGSTSSITYQPYWNAEGGYGTLYLNCQQGDPDGGAYLHNISTITLMEIAA